MAEFITCILAALGKVVIPMDIGYIRPLSEGGWRGRNSNLVKVSWKGDRQEMNHQRRESKTQQGSGMESRRGQLHPGPWNNLLEDGQRRAQTIRVLTVTKPFKVKVCTVVSNRYEAVPTKCQG